MSTKNKSRNKIGCIVVALFLFVETIFTIISLGLIISGQNFRKTAKETQGTIVDFKRTSSDDSPTVYLKYNADGRDYVSTINYYSSSIKYGDKLTIYYQPANPLSIQTSDGDKFIMMIFLPIGILFILFGIFLIIRNISSKSRDKYLLQHGDRLITTISEVVKNTGLEVNSRNPYVVYSVYKAPDGTVHEFKSRNLFCNRNELPDEGTVPVYVEGLNYKKYLMDVDNIKPADNQQESSNT